MTSYSHSYSSDRSAPTSSRGAVAGVAVTILIAVIALTWAKWSPYVDRVDTIVDTDTYPGASILETAGEARSGPSLAGGWDFTVAYFKAVWQALVAALLIAAAVQSLVPRRWLVRTLSPTRFPTLAAGLCSLPSMMCSCCTAPVASSLRRSGVRTAGSLAYWIGNPVLNPAVLVFLAILLPWQWVVTRVLAGVLLVFVVTAWVARLAGDRPVPPEAVVPDEGQDPARPAPVRYVRALARLAVVLVPEYLVVVFAVGALRGWAFPFEGGIDDFAVLAVLAAVVAGTLVVIPTGGEIPILTGLAAAGAGAGVIGALLIVLPAICLPSMVMVAGALSWRVTIAMAAGVAATGLLAAGLMYALGG
jgi:uncharacterized protein